MSKSEDVIAPNKDVGSFNQKSRGSLLELGLIFLRLGAIGFGGPAAHIAMMEEEVVKRKKWLTHEYFLDLLGASNIIPGPNSTEMAIHIGYVRAGWKGVVIAGSCFIFPAVIITLIFAQLYVEYSTFPHVGEFIWGIRAAVIAVILAAGFRLGKPMLKKPFAALVAATVCALSLFHTGEITLLFSAGILGILWENRNRWKQSRSTILLTSILPVILIQAIPLTSPAVAATPTLTALGIFFIKIGSILYGSGYVLVAFLQTGLVEFNHWLTQKQLLDAIAVGQFTPGPVLSTATFVGYLILGFPGASVSTVGIFLPSFVFVLVSAPFIPKLRKSSVAAGFLNGVNAASLGLMLAVCISLCTSTLTNVGSWLIFAIAAIVVILWNIHAAWIVGGAAFLGWLISAFGI